MNTFSFIHLVQEGLRHLEFGAEFGNGRQDRERGGIGIIEGGRKRSGAEVKAMQNGKGTLIIYESCIALQIGTSRDSTFYLLTSSAKKKKFNGDND